MEKDMNYIIKGTSRCGKTMLTNLIVQKLVGYNKLSTDTLIQVFDRVMPNEKINHERGKGMNEKFPAFLKDLFLSSIKKITNLGFSMF